MHIQSRNKFINHKILLDSMNLAHEAGYLYWYAKKLNKVNKKLKRLSEKAQKHAKKYAAASGKDRERHFKKHHAAREEIQELMKVHHRVMNIIKHHLMRFHDTFRKQPKL